MWSETLATWQASLKYVEFSESPQNSDYWCSVYRMGPKSCEFIDWWLDCHLRPSGCERLKALESTYYSPSRQTFNNRNFTASIQSLGKRTTFTRARQQSLVLVDLGQQPNQTVASRYANESELDSNFVRLRSDFGWRWEWCLQAIHLWRLSPDSRRLASLSFGVCRCFFTWQHPCDYCRWAGPHPALESLILAI